jgi:transcriptional regulator with XRE-family HTH domain
MERGRGLPDENTLQSIADKLGTTVDYLTDKTDKKERPSAEAKSLSEIEKEILEIYHTLPEDKKQAFMTVARSLKSQSKDK